MSKSIHKIYLRFLLLIFLNFACFMGLMPVRAYFGNEYDEQIRILVNEGINYHNNRNYILSIKSFRKAYQLDPENVEIGENLSIAHNNYGKYLAERTDSYGAIREFRNALFFDSKNDTARKNLEKKMRELNFNPLSVDERILQSKKERHRNEYFAAIAEAREANNIKNTSSGYVEIGLNHYFLSIKYHSRKDYHFDKAKQSFETAVRLAPDDPTPNMKLGDIFVSTGKISQGINYYQSAIRISPDNQEAQSALINGWLAAIRVAPHVASNYVGLGTAYQLKGDFVQAERSFKRALQLDGNSDMAMKGLERLKEDRIATQFNLYMDNAVRLQSEGKIDDSLSEYVKALSVRPEDPSVHYNIGTAFQAKQDYLRARKAYQKAVDLDPSNEEARKAVEILTAEEKRNNIDEAFARAVALQGEEKYLDAIAIYQRISADKADDPNLFYNLAIAHHALKNYDDAIDNYKKAYALNEEDSYLEAISTVKLDKANDLLAVGIKEQSQGNTEIAIEKYEQVTSLVPSNANAWYNLGTAYQAVGTNDKALNAYQKAFELDDAGQSDAMFFAALILEEQRKLIDAIDLYDKYQKIAPDGTYIKESRERKEYIKSFL